MKRILIGGTSSGCGKTTVTCALLSALKLTGYIPSAFKCGPDYIDPMFHRSITGIRACSLDSFFCGPDLINGLLNEYSRGSDIAVIEGVMGFYDGEALGASGDIISRITGTPSVLVVDCRGINESAGAVIKGFLNYRDSHHIRGIIFNRLAPSRVADMEKICRELGTIYLGYLPKAGFMFYSRSLGLITADEVKDLKEKLEALGKLALEHLKMDRILELAGSALDKGQTYFGSASCIHGSSGNNDSMDKSFSFCHADPCKTRGPVIAVARDRAFCFIYQENLDFLKKLGCRIEYFSPLNDESLPEGSSGLILCGGYPELYAAELCGNTCMRKCIHDAVSSGMPCIAECGGFMYLHKYMVTEDGTRLEMAGVIDGEVYHAGRLKRFGYASLKAETDGMICSRGDIIRTHEFHYWESTACGGDFTASKPDKRSWKCGYNTKSLYAGFPHLYFYAAPETAGRFAESCRRYSAELGK